MVVVRLSLTAISFPLLHTLDPLALHINFHLCHLFLSARPETDGRWPWGISYHGAMFQLVHDGGLGLTCYDWVPPTVSKGVQHPMSLLYYGSVTLEREEDSGSFNLKVKHGNPRITLGQSEGSLQIENTYFRDLDVKKLSNTDQNLLGEWLSRKDPVG